MALMPLYNERGCPQGSILSPILAHISLHYVIDGWFDEISQSMIQGWVEMVRLSGAGCGSSASPVLRRGLYG
jgi:hypothetical protein